MSDSPPNTELREDLKRLITGSEFQDYLYSDPNECVDAILALFQAHQQESKTSPTQIREAEQGGLETPEDTAKPSHNQVDNLSPNALDAAMRTLGHFHAFSNAAWSDVEEGVHAAHEYREYYEQAKRKAINDILTIAIADGAVTDLQPSYSDTNSRQAKAQILAEYKQLLTELPEFAGEVDASGRFWIDREGLGFNEALDQCRAIIQSKIKELE